MMRLMKEIISNGLYYRLQISDEIMDMRLMIATHVEYYPRVITILLGLKDFPEEIREKIFKEHVHRTFEEWYYTDMVERQIFCELQIEKSKLMYEKMDDYAEFVEALAKADVNINDTKEIHDFFDETYNYLKE
jgi:hypothetical protein